jgi:NADPH-dependent 2,4-dienoyl-CoA reductase/sulfur reductase-like enzyme/rhodanese-related sulfurtransferase
VTRRRVVIVGGVAGGMSAATRLRRNDETLEIIVLERGDHVSFANCGLPYHVGGVIESREALLLQTPASLASRFAIDVRIGHEVTAIDTVGRRVTVRAAGRETDLAYDELVLAPGAAPVRPPVEGIERALTLRDVADLDQMSAALADGPRSVTILGAGFIGLELAENLLVRGLEVTVVELGDQVLAPLDREMAAVVQGRLVERGVVVRLGVSAVRVLEDKVQLSDGSMTAADLVVAAIGVRPESSLARLAGLEVGARGGIVVDDHQRASAPHVYAVGDVAEKRDALDGETTLVPLAQTANRHGRLVADVITGRATSALPVLGAAVVGVLGLTVATVGWNERRARAAGRNLRIAHTHPAHHAGYYPGAESMSLKLVVDAETDQILGAQAVGGAGVDKRIDIIATAMRGGLRASDLADLELAYAPQYGSAKDPINMLGFIADNLATGYERNLQWHELDASLAKGSVLVDVRTRDEHARAAIPGSLNIPIDELRERLAEIPDVPVVVHCEVGQRGHLAARLLDQQGFDVVNLDGGFRTWQAGTGSRTNVSEDR